MGIPNWIAKFVGKWVGSKLKLKEDNEMADETSKKWWQSKTIWSGVVAVLIAAYSTAASNFNLPAIPEWVFAILGGIGIYGRVTAEKKIG